MKKNQKRDRVVIRSLRNPSVSHRRGIMYLRSTPWGNSFLAQKIVCESYRDRNNIELLTDEFTDESQHITGLATYQSPGFDDVLEYCTEHMGKVDVLLVASRDLLGTNTAEYLRCRIDLQKLGVEIRSASDVEDIDSPMEHIRGVLESE